MLLAILVTLYGFVGLGFAIALLYNEKLCPKSGGELFFAMIFWLPLIFGWGLVQLWQNILPVAEKSNVAENKIP